MTDQEDNGEICDTSSYAAESGATPQSNPPNISPGASPRVGSDSEENGETQHIEYFDPKDHEGKLFEHDITPLVSKEPETSSGAGPRRRSTLMLDDDKEVDAAESMSRASSGDQLEFDRRPPLSHTTDGLIETVIEWKQGGHEVFLTGSFSGWRQMIPMRHVESGAFVVVLKLAPGTHRLRFIVDGEMRISDSMHTATDSMGNLLNYMEVLPHGKLEYWPVEEEEEEEEEVLEYSQNIPEILEDFEVLSRLSTQDFSTPPQLPPHLDGVILNANWNEKDNNSVLPIPNHVVLNHLATTSIRHNVLAVASVSRYSAKYVTQILYTPL